MIQERKEKFKPKKCTKDYKFNLGTSKQASDYILSATYIINHIKKRLLTGNNIAKSLRLHQETDVSKWKPTLQVRDEDDPMDQSRLNKQY